MFFDDCEAGPHGTCFYRWPQKHLAPQDNWGNGYPGITCALKLLNAYIQSCIRRRVTKSLSLSPLFFLVNLRKQKLDPKKRCVWSASFITQKLGAELVPMVFLIGFYIGTFSSQGSPHFVENCTSVSAFRWGGCQHVTITRNFLPQQFIRENCGTVTIGISL